MSTKTEMTRTKYNRTLVLSEEECQHYSKKLKKLNGLSTIEEVRNVVINQNVFEILDWLPQEFVDLMVIDPPYNISKSFNGKCFSVMTLDEYADWMESWLPRMIRLLKPTATVYICGDWRSSTSIHLVAAKYLKVRNRITWEREKGRGAKSNWKNCSEDIWMCTVSHKYVFNVDKVKLRRRVIAPYKTETGEPKGWIKSAAGNFRDTYPSNLWTDITVPFWSMPENTIHPTQKPEKLMAKLILASSNPGDMVFDPFMGSGTTCVVAKKLGRNYCGVEIDESYCCIAEKRLAMAETDREIQGYKDGVFWERNTFALQKQNLLVSKNGSR